MPRRPSKKSQQSKNKPKPSKKSSGSIKKWNTLDDIPMDEEDHFHASRDKILLEGDDHGGHSDDGDDEEVFALKGVDIDSDQDEEYDYDEDHDVELDEAGSAELPKPKKKAKKLKKGKGKATQSSDEEQDSTEEEEESWGQGRAAYYSSNAREIDSDDEEANEMEEQEARRLQLKIRQDLQNGDFGLDDEVDTEEQTEANDIFDPEPLEGPALPTDKQALVRHLEKINPESLALARDWDDTVHKLEKTRLKIEKTEVDKSDSLSLGMIHIHYQTLLSYSTVLAFYLHLRTGPKYAQRPVLLQTHPIMQRLLTLKQALHTLEDLDFAVSDDEDEEDVQDNYSTVIDFDDTLGDAEGIWKFDKAGGLEPNELDDLLNDAGTSASALDSPTEKPRKKKRKVVAQDSAEEPTTNSTSKSKKKPRTAAPVFDLVEPQFVSSKTSSRPSTSDDAHDAFGDATTLSTFDAADKNARKKSLRFHTSKIESSSARRQGARNQAIGGDDDIPYRERKKEKDSRLVTEAARRAEQQAAGADLDDQEPETRVGQKRSRGEDDDDDNGSIDGGSGDDYYELVKKKSKEDKEKKKAEYEEVHGLSRVPLEEEASGPRSLTRAILKNRGLTPSRPKAVRNPRVKKRQKFDKAKKKLASQKAIFKGGLAESKGRYEGEKTGISKVVKSVRLG